MKNILLLLLGLFLLSTNIQAQTTYCSDLVEYVEDEGSYYGADSFYSSSALSKITWYEVDGAYYALVRFTSSYTSYIYGGFSYGDYRKVRSYIKDASSAGSAFHNSLGKYKLNCY